MGRQCGFEFYKLKDGKIVEAPVIKEDYDDNFCNYVYFCGRCEATDIFLEAVIQKTPHGLWYMGDYKPEEKYSVRLLMNHPELDGFEVHKEKEDSNSPFSDWFKKFFYVGTDKFKSLFDFEKAQQDHDNAIKEAKERIHELLMEIETIRLPQEKAKTEVAFKGFSETIKELKEEIQSEKSFIKGMENDDYDYDHYMYIKNDLELVEKLIKEDPELIVAAFASD